MGAVQVPVAALWGASTQRAVDSFPISALRLGRRFIAALGEVKAAAADANLSLGLLERERGEAIRAAAREVAAGRWYEQFVVDLFQSGSGTATNMNANEVIANRALELLGHTRGERGVVHPNDHVNLGQSSNDVVPTALHLAAHRAISLRLLPAVRALQAALAQKAQVYRGLVTVGRTHLQDATPITLGQEFGAYSAQMLRGVERLERGLKLLLPVALGGTAVGSGVGAHPQFAERAIAALAHATGASFREADNHFEAQAVQEGAVEVSAIVRTVALSVMKLVDDIRWLASSPRCALGEIAVPVTQPGSSMMPAKVNAVECESTLMACANMLASDAAVVVAAQHGNFQLNTMLPLLAYHLVEGIDILGAAIGNFTQRCVHGITADVARCREFAERSLSLVTALVPKLGYDRATEIGQEAQREGRTILAIALERTDIPQSELERLLDPLGQVGSSGVY
jgi:fumarate hydratase class II